MLVSVDRHGHLITFIAVTELRHGKACLRILKVHVHVFIQTNLAILKSTDQITIDVYNVYMEKKVFLLEPI